MKKLCLFFSLIGFGAIAQNNLKISFTPYNASAPLEFNTTVSNLSGVDYKVSTLYYYISNIHVIHDGGQDLDLSDTVVIIKNDDFVLDFGMQNITNVEQVNFGVGVPQDKNHLDISLYPIGHPLSYQTPSMQWGWTSGYNQVGIVAQSDDNGDGNPTHPFELFPLDDALYRSVQLPVSSGVIDGALQVKIHTNLDQWLSNIDIATIGIVHGSTGNNVTLMNNVNDRPVFTAEMDLGINTIENSNGKLTFTTDQEIVTVLWDELQGADHFTIQDVNGKTVKEGIITNKKGEISFSSLSGHFYWFVISSKDGNQLNKIRIVK